MRRRGDDGGCKLAQEPGGFFAEFRSIGGDTLSQLIQFWKEAFEAGRAACTKEANRG